MGISLQSWMPETQHNMYLQTCIAWQLLPRAPVVAKAACLHCAHSHPYPVLQEAAETAATADALGWAGAFAACLAVLGSMKHCS